MKYEKWLGEWLENYICPSIKNKTYTRYRGIVYQHIMPKLGSIEIGEITPIELQHFVTELLKCGNIKNGKELSVNSVNSIITIFKAR